MGLLDRWTKRQEQKKLEQVKQPADLKTADKAAAVTTETKTVKTKTEKAVKTAAPKKETAKDAVVEAKISLTADKILIRPLVTEKSAVAQSHNKYGFVVERSATGAAVKRAIAEAYGVTPVKVNLINASGKWVRFGRNMGRRSDFKKAIVTLPKGKSIAIHEGV